MDHNKFKTLAIVADPNEVVRIDDSSTGFRIFSGADFSPQLALEVGFSDFGDFDATESRVNPNIGLNSFNSSFETQSYNFKGFDVSLIGKYTVSPMISLTGLLGVLFWDFDTTWNYREERAINGKLVNNTLSSSDSINGSDLFFGVGGEFNHFSPYTIKVGFTKYKFKGNKNDLELNEKIDSFSISLTYPLDKLLKGTKG